MMLAVQAVVKDALRRGRFRIIDLPEHRILMGLQLSSEANGIKKTRNAIILVSNRDRRLLKDAVNANSLSSLLGS